MFDTQQSGSSGMGSFPPFMNGQTPSSPNAWSSPDQLGGGFPGGGPGFPGASMMPNGIPMLPTDPAMLQQLHPGMVPVPAPGMPPWHVHDGAPAHGHAAIPGPNALPTGIPEPPWFPQLLGMMRELQRALVLNDSAMARPL